MRSMTQALTHELRLFLVALQFLTRIPTPRWVGFEPVWLNRSARHFPVVGLVVGAVAALVLAIGHALFTPVLAALLSIAATACLTGAFHEDGLADTCDALGGDVGRERALEIMKDSRIGSYGALALVLAIGIKAAALAALPLPQAIVATLLAHCASRAAAVSLIRSLPYARDVGEAKARPLAERVSAGTLAIALGWVGVAFVGASLVERDAMPSVIGLLAAALGTWLLGRWFRRRLGGITGDTLGATQQVTELLVLLGGLAVLRWH